MSHVIHPLNGPYIASEGLNPNQLTPTLVSTTWIECWMNQNQRYLVLSCLLVFSVTLSLCFLVSIHIVWSLFVIVSLLLYRTKQKPQKTTKQTKIKLKSSIIHSSWTSTSPFFHSSLSAIDTYRSHSPLNFFFLSFCELW